LKNPSGLPAEFKTLGIVPAPWTPAVVISRHNALVANVEEEVKLAQAVRLLGPETVKDLEYFQGGDPSVTPDSAIDLSLVDSSILDLYTKFRTVVRFAGGEAPAPEDPEDIDRREDIGRNNWFVAG